MKVLVAFASKHGGTREIAQAITAVFRTHGLSVDLHNMEDELVDVSQYDGLVLGSAIYAGNWPPQAKSFVRLHAEELAKQRVWLFSSVPSGKGEPQPHIEPGKPITGLEGVPVIEHRIFVGKLNPAALSLGERFMAKVVGAPAGDFRDWDSVRAWAGEVAAG